MLMITDIGVGSSKVRSRPAVPAGALSGLSADGEEGMLPALQLHIASEEARTNANDSSVLRIAQAGARAVPSANARQLKAYAAGTLTGGVIPYVHGLEIVIFVPLLSVTSGSWFALAE